MEASNKKSQVHEPFEKPPLRVIMLMYLGLGILNILGRINDFLKTIGLIRKVGYKDPNPPVSNKFYSFVPLNLSKSLFPNLQSQNYI